MNISVVIVTYNPNISKLEAILDKLIFEKVMQIYIVDNCSDNFSEVNSLEGNNITISGLSENLGIAYAQNIGIAEAINKENDYIIFFDQDSSLDNDFIKKLYYDFSEINKIDKKIAAIGPRFIDENKGFYFPALKFNKYGLIDKISVENITTSVEVSFLISSGTLVSVKALKEIGLMKEEYFIDYVDTEWCFRALSIGYNLYMSEKAVMKHSIGDDTIKLLNFKIPVHSGLRRYYRIRNLFFMWKMSYIPKILVVKLMVTNFAIQILLFIFKDKKMDYLKYYLKAIRDGIKQSRNYHG